MGRVSCLLFTLLTAGLLAACGGDDGSLDTGTADTTANDTASADVPDVPAAGDESPDAVDTPPEPDAADAAADQPAADLGGDDLPVEDLPAADSATQDLGPQDVPAPDVAPEDLPGDAGPAGACMNAADQAVLAAPGFEDAVQQCTTGCIMSADRRKCAEDCLVEGPGLSPTCASCFGAAVDCTVANCLTACIDGGEDCTSCRIEKCGAAFEDCAGFAMQ